MNINIQIHVCNLRKWSFVFDNEKPFVGMTNFKGNYVTKDDVKIAKNYLSEIETEFKETESHS